MVITLLITLFFSLFTFNLFNTHYFLISNRYSALFSLVFSGLNSMVTSSYKFLFSSVLVFILIINLIGNIPGFSISTIFYFFSASFSLTVWVSLMLVVGATQLKPFLAHILPFGAPEGLILILPLIEIFSHLIRPFTLIIRLSTNLSSGHIIIYMFSFFSLSSFGLTVLISVVLGILFLLELIISALQAYIFSSLAYLYVSETS